MPVAAGNDASIGALAESRFGVGVGVGNLLYLGGAMHSIGGGLIIDGTLLRGTSGYAGSSATPSSTRADARACADAAGASRPRSAST